MYHYNIGTAQSTYKATVANQCHGPQGKKVPGNKSAQAISKFLGTSYATGIVPEDWKTANVTVIHKKSDKTIPDKNRPIKYSK